MITFACVLRQQKSNHGVLYTEQWVERLYNGIERNYDGEFDFVCLSDQPTRFKTIAFQVVSDGYWNKIELFRKNIFDTETVVYLDLDVVLCGNITDEIAKLPRSKFFMTREPYRGIHNSSLMIWGGDHSDLYLHYRNNQQAVVQEYQYNLARPGCIGDQAFIGENVRHEVIENFVRPGFVGWVHHKIKTDLDQPSILIFTGSQKPSNNLHLDLVRQHWI